ncbi:MAG: tRNA (guanosine(37)-N1)-methyltransferase TrmD [Patescibacteria group bacterium]|nr:tRNA (guanosine(37)-N1)-methyltransferase TrmD [Patescibacteria group bacterium]
MHAEAAFLMITFDIITIFPDSISAYLKESILGRAQAKKLIKINLHDIRKYSEDRHRKVDDRPYGGGPGMVMTLQPLLSCFNNAVRNISRRGGKEVSEIIVFRASGKRFDDKMAGLLAKRRKNIILICGHYEGIDGRLIKIIKDMGWKVSELSIGPYVLTGGEIPAMAVVDAVSRKIKGVLGKEESLEEKRYGVGTKVFTRPEEFKWRGKKYGVPKDLVSGNHRLIEKWRLEHREK